jgi:hypothetical protein
MGSSNFDAKLTKSAFGDFEAVRGLGYRLLGKTRR